MPLIIAGIDEAGYGPLLGPLCVGCAVLKVEDWAEGRPAPNLWSLLSEAVSQTPDRTHARIAVADSKKLKLPNDTRTRHPLTHLERGVLSFAAVRAGASPITTEDALFESLGIACRGHDAYHAAERTLPVAWSADQMSIASNVLSLGLSRAGVSVLALRCHVIFEEEFNGIIERAGSKGDTTLCAIGEHLRGIVRCLEGVPGDVRVVCDRLGGRVHYAQALRDLLPDAERVSVLEESSERSRYAIDLPGVRPIVSFQSEGESAHLPVALASMIAKYVRELFMARFNEYWSARIPEIKPTAGYTLDGRRWLHDAASVLTPADRRLLVRRA